MKTRTILARGYRPRPDGTYAKTVTFAYGKNTATETLVRTLDGPLRVERGKRALALRRARA